MAQWKVTSSVDGESVVLFTGELRDAKAALLDAMTNFGGRRWTNEGQDDQWFGPWYGTGEDEEPVFLGAQHG